MPLKTPVGPLQLLEEAVAEARRLSDEELAARHPNPVLVVVGPAEAWADTTKITYRRDSGSDAPSMLPPVVIAVAPGRFTAESKRLAIGRAHVCDVVLPFSEISKVHAYLNETLEHEWQIEDAGSTNGTSVNSAAAARGHPQRVADAAAIKFGDVSATFYLAPSFRAELRRKGGL